MYKDGVWYLYYLDHLILQIVLLSGVRQVYISTDLVHWEDKSTIDNTKERGGLSLMLEG